MMLTLPDFIMVTEPLLAKWALHDILAATENVQWRTPQQDYVRTCTTYPISAALSGNYPIPNGQLGIVKAADDALLAAALTGLKVYKEKHQLTTHADIGFDILRYEKGQSIGPHVDDLAPRFLTMSIVLNDEFTGGEFRFWHDDDYIFKVPAGCAIIFPPTFMYPHEILPIKSGIRYAMITWFV